MNPAVWTKVAAKTAAEVCARFDLGAEAKGLLRDGTAPGPFVQTLLEKAQYVDACRFFAYALPKREAVWWTCLCLRAVKAAEAPKLAEVLTAVEKWVRDPSDENRRAAWAAAQPCLDTPVGCAAMAAFFSGDSLAPPNVAAVPPDEHLGPRAVTGAVMLAAVQSEPQNAAEKYRKFLAVAADVAGGVNPWK